MRRRGRNMYSEGLIPAALPSHPYHYHDEGVFMPYQSSHHQLLQRTVMDQQGMIMNHHQPNYPLYHHHAQAQAQVQVQVQDQKPCHPLISMTNDPKPRLRWTPELHARFVDAVNQLGGPFEATPKNIMNVMDIDELTLYQLKSHLQKYRLRNSKPHKEDTYIVSSDRHRKRSKSSAPILEGPSGSSSFVPPSPHVNQNPQGSYIGHQNQPSFRIEHEKDRVECCHLSHDSYLKMASDRASVLFSNHEGLNNPPPPPPPTTTINHHHHAVSYITPIRNEAIKEYAGHRRGGVIPGSFQPHKFADYSSIDNYLVSLGQTPSFVLDEYRYSAPELGPRLMDSEEDPASTYLNLDVADNHDGTVGEFPWKRQDHD
ncbi:unnamed protein product [Camellia sinensis]